MADITKEQVVEFIANMTVLELSAFIKELEEKFGVSAAAPVAAFAAAPVAAAESAEEEKTEFDVILKEAGANKIGIIKVVRALTSLGLKEAKEKVDVGDVGITGLAFLPPVKLLRRAIGVLDQ